MAVARETDILSLAAIRSGRGKSKRYLFYERQRIFALAERVAADPPSVRLLKQALDKQRPVKVLLSARRGLIHSVRNPTPQELEEFARTHLPLEKPDRTVRIEVSTIDPTTFNFVDLSLKWRTFSLCDKIVPGYAKAREMFDFCAQLSCHLPGPYVMPPCIPFQYVRDGCYARAHQMRRIITERYGFCCEKVFSFATSSDDELAVKADKWGGCCVIWWYHVAPLIRVRLRLKGLPKGKPLVMAMVIDPGMFDEPVPLSTWLAAQETTACASDARVTSYSIQPGAAYQPKWSGGFTTDPGYSNTDFTLFLYRSAPTC